MPTRQRLRTTTWDDFALFHNTDGIIDPRELQAPERPSTWARSALHEAVIFREGEDPQYEYLARMVLASAAVDARQLSPNMALIARRARRWLRTPSEDLAFWCRLAGVEVKNLVAWADAQFPVHTDPKPPGSWLKYVVKTRQGLRLPKEKPPELSDAQWARMIATVKARTTVYLEDRPDLIPLRRPKGEPAHPKGPRPKTLVRSHHKAARYNTPHPCSGSMSSSRYSSGACSSVPRSDSSAV